MLNIEKYPLPMHVPRAQRKPLGWATVLYYPYFEGFTNLLSRKVIGVVAIVDSRVT